MAQIPQFVVEIGVWLILALIAVVIYFLRGTINDVKQLKTEFSEFKSKFARLELQTELWWSVIEKHTAELLKSYPTNVKKDVLLEKMIHNELEIEDAFLLRTILSEEMKLEKTKDKLIYVLALGRIEQIIFDLKPR